MMPSKEELRGYAPSHDFFGVFVLFSFLTGVHLLGATYGTIKYGLVGNTAIATFELAAVCVIARVIISPLNFKEAWEKFKSHTVIGHDLVLTRGTHGTTYRVERIDRRKTHLNTGQFAVYVRLGGWFNWPSARIGQNDDGTVRWVKSVRIRMTRPNSMIVTGPTCRVPMEVEHFLAMTNLIGIPDPAVMLKRAVNDLGTLKHDLQRENGLLLAECEQHSQTAQRLRGYDYMLNNALDAMQSARGRIEAGTRLRQRAPMESRALDEFLKDWHDELLTRRTRINAITPNAVMPETMPNVSTTTEKGLRGFA